MKMFHTRRLFYFTGTRCFVGTLKVVTPFLVRLHKRILTLQTCVNTGEGIS